MIACSMVCSMWSYLKYSVLCTVSPDQFNCRMDDYGEERDVGENVVHSIIRGNRMMPVIPPQPPPLPPISSVMNSGAMMWALSHTPGYEPSQPPASLRARYYETAVSRQSGPNIFCHMGTIDDKVITPMYEVDVVFLHGRHGAGKTTLVSRNPVY